MVLHTLLPIVEGQSEVAGIPILLRRLALHLGYSHVGVEKPFRIHRTRVLKKGEIERAVVQGLRTRTNVSAVVVVLDADDDEPLQLEHLVREECRRATPLPVAVAAATRELEAWFLGAKGSLRGWRGIRADAAPPPDPEQIRGAKERLTRNMEGGRRYIEVDDQPAFAERLDLASALASCASFARLADELRRALERDLRPEAT